MGVSASIYKCGGYLPNSLLTSISAKAKNRAPPFAKWENLHFTLINLNLKGIYIFSMSQPFSKF